MSESISRHLYSRRVQFAETDLAGMVHFSWHARYVEEAEHALWREAGLSIADPASEVGFPRVAFSIEYHAPLRFEDEIEVDITIEAISNRAIRYRSVVRRAGTTVATSLHTAVCVSRGEMKAVDIPAAIREKLATHEPGPSA